MVVELEHLPQGDGVLVTGTGSISASDIVRIQELIYTDSRLPNLRFILVDLSAVQHFDASAEELRDLAKADITASQALKSLLIAVVGTEDVVFGLARMWSAWAETSGLETRVCRTVPEAEAWIAEKLSPRD